MIVLSIQQALKKARAKAVICPQCKRGKVGYVSASVRIRNASRGAPPDGENEKAYIIRCAHCGAFVTLTTE